MFGSTITITLATLALGLTTGLLSGTLGIGGGIVVVPTLVLLFSMSQKGAQAVSLALMVPMALLGAFQYWRFGHLQLSGGRLILLITGALAGVLLGTVLADRLPAVVLRRCFAVLIMLVAIRMLWPDSKPAAAKAAAVAKTP